MSRQFTGYTIERLPNHIFLNVERFEYWLMQNAKGYDKLYNLEDWLMDLVNQNGIKGNEDYCLHAHKSENKREMFFGYSLEIFWDQTGNEPILYLFDMDYKGFQEE